MNNMRMWGDDGEGEIFEMELSDGGGCGKRTCWDDVDELMMASQARGQGRKMAAGFYL